MFKTLEKLRADGYSWYAEDGKTIEYKLTGDIYHIQKKIAKNINVALFWYESILHSNDPSLVWGDVDKQFKNLTGWKS
jgi:hypothetical protein